MIRVGIVGYGMAAQVFHIPLLLDNPAFDIRAVVSSQTEAVQSALPQALVFDDLERMLAEVELDLVVITTPNHLHYPQAKQCLEADLAVVLEKPMTTDLADAERLKALCEARHGFLRVYHNRRFDGDFLTVQKLIQSGQLGSVKLFQSHWDRFRPVVRDRWRESAINGAGIWFDLAPHLLDQALRLFGMPKALSARLSILRDGGQSDDYAHVLLHYDTHEVILHTSPFQAAPNPRFTVQGSAGTFVKYGLDLQEAQLKAGFRPSAPDFGLDDKALYGTLYRDNQAPEIIPTERGQFGTFYSQLADALTAHRQNKPLLNNTLASLDDAINVMRLLTLAQQSALEGKTLFL